MGLLRYSYVTTSQFLPAIRYHAFKLRAIPAENSFQHLQEHRMAISPECSIATCTDGFGNSIQFGSICTEHDYLTIESSGVVEVADYWLKDEYPADIYRFPTVLTQWNKDICQLATEKDALEIMHSVHQYLTYERFVTNNHTTALQVFEGRKGVCQDYAHLMIAACRGVGLPARYVNGLALGEGETHAWVEVWQQGVWRGYDPTYDCPVLSGYLKFAHGRDVNDCPSNRGRFYGWTSEQMTVHCKLEQL